MEENEMSNSEEEKQKSISEVTMGNFIVLVVS